jgi:hypothetical protein
MLRGVLTWEDDEAPPIIDIDPPIDPPIDPLPPDADLGLIYPSDLHYLGCFRLPSYPVRFDYPPKGMAFCGAHESLFINGFADFHATGEVSIPTPIKGALTLADLNRAIELQPLQDPTEGSIWALTYGAALNLGGLHVHRERLLVTAYRHYDADGNQPFSHWSRHLNLSKAGDYLGPVTLDVTAATETSSVHAGNVSGYMGAIAPEWQERFRGVCFTGQAGIPIVSRTSLGPGLFSFDPADIGVKDPVPTHPLLFYPGSHPTLGPYTPGPNDPNPNPLFNGTMQIGAVIQPVGTRSVLFFGAIGVGKYAYGQGTGDASLDGTPVPGYNNEVFYCFDPVNYAKGDHAWPYLAWVWAYDALDLAKVAAGTMQPWEPVPYAVWELDSDFYSWLPRLSAATYDPDTQRIFVNQTRGDGDAPLCHVYSCAQATARAARFSRQLVRRAGLHGLSAFRSRTKVTLGADR